MTAMNALPRQISVWIIFCMLAGAGAAMADRSPVFVSGFGNYAIRGYDAVAYHLQSKPVKGKNAYATEWNGAAWRFASAGNRDQFAQDPERWAPRYGGYCAWAVSNNYIATTDPDAWSIVDGRLYLNYSKAVRATWSQDIPGNIQRGDANWPQVLSK